MGDICGACRAVTLFAMRLARAPSSLTSHGNHRCRSSHRTSQDPGLRFLPLIVRSTTFTPTPRLVTMSTNGDSPAADVAGDSRDPSGFLSEIIGAPVTVKLNSGIVYKGMQALRKVYSFNVARRSAVCGWLHEHRPRTMPGNHRRASYPQLGRRLCPWKQRYVRPPFRVRCHADLSVVTYICADKA